MDHGGPTELFIGLVAAVGTDIETVVAELERELTGHQYSSTLLRLSEYLEFQFPERRLDEQPFDVRVFESMTAGDELRAKWDRDDALALLAIEDVVATRQEKSQGTIDVFVSGSLETLVPASLERHAFLFRSFKTPGEVATMRAIYGKRFVLIAAYSPDERRASHLAGLIEAKRGDGDRSRWDHSPEELIERDLKEERKGGQDVSGTFHQADFFVRADSPTNIRQDVSRTVEILFGHPFRTPTRDEQGQFIAAGAARRSAEPGRQVGAAIADRDGSVLAIGTNEVPVFGGGSHWEEDGDGNREFEHSIRETNRVHQETIAKQLSTAVMEAAEAATNDVAEFDEEDRAELADRFLDAAEQTLMTQGLNEISEFGRAVHAEMSAILDAAKRGVSIRGATLYTTTFPCHNCARHIIGAGIERLVFIEPYPKSRALRLHDDSIDMNPPFAPGKVPFEPFVGVAPRRFHDYFDAAARERQGHVKRKADDGTLNAHDKSRAIPVFADHEPPELRPAVPSYRLKELNALIVQEEIEVSNPDSAAGAGEASAENGIKTALRKLFRRQQTS